MDALSAVLKGPTEKGWTDVIAFAEANLEPILARAFVQAMKNLRGRFTQRQLEKLISRGPEALAQAVIGGYSHEAVFEDLRDSVQASMVRSAKYFKDSAKITLKFNAFHGSVVDAAQAQTYNLIQQIRETTRAGIKTYVSSSLTSGVNPRETARQIRSLIGLTERQTNAVFNYRRFLEQGDPQALERALRDHRSDAIVRAAVESGKGLSKSYVDKLVDKYQQRYINYRAEVIARTEAINSLHAAQDVLWGQAVESGDIDADQIIRHWYVAKDERTCPLCSPVPGLNPKGVGLGQEFVTPNGSAMNAPLHPQCRCIVFTKLLIRGKQAA